MNDSVNEANEVQDPSEPNRVENDVQVESNEADGSVDAPPAGEDGNQDISEEPQAAQPLQDQSAQPLAPSLEEQSDSQENGEELEGAVPDASQPSTDEAANHPDEEPREAVNEQNNEN